MSRRRELDQHRRQLGEISEIMRSMKNLAYMETRKLSRLLEAQAQALAVIESAAEDFLAFYPEMAKATESPCRVMLLIGSERGFCGDFNEELLRAVAGKAGSDAPLIAVGGRLTTHLDAQWVKATLLEGPGVAEEVAAVLKRLVTAIGDLQEACGVISLSVWHHRNGAPDLDHKVLLPPFADRVGTGQSGSGYAPLLNLTPERFFADLVDQHLLAVLHEIFYTSLMAENQRRIQHLEVAIRRLDDKAGDYARQSRILRQEEITEEIEVILLSAGDEGDSPALEILGRGT